MQDDSLHYVGETVVHRGPWHMEIPLDFVIYWNPEEYIGLREQASMAVARFISEEAVLQAEMESNEAAILSDDDVDED